MEISNTELRWLNFYRASELHGGLLLGQLVRRVRDPDLMLDLTRHSAEEIVHAQLWTETILAVGGRPRPVRDTYQARYSADVGFTTSALDVLTLTQVFERRVYRHFIDHARRPGTHPEVRRTLLRMIDEEKSHLEWVKRWLDEQAERRPHAVRDRMRHFSRVDERVYQRLITDYGYRKVA